MADNNNNQKPNHTLQIVGSALVGVGSWFVGDSSIKVKNFVDRVKPDFSGKMPDVAQAAKNKLIDLLGDSVNFNQEKGSKILEDILSVKKQFTDDSQKNIKYLYHKVGELNAGQYALLAAGTLALAGGTAYLLRPKTSVEDVQHEGVLQHNKEQQTQK